MTKPLLFLTCQSILTFAFGCHTDESPRHPGIVVTHVDYYGSGTGTSSELLKTDPSEKYGCIRSGFQYKNPSKTDWTSTIKWHFVARRGPCDVYRFDWKYANKAGAYGEREIEYDGHASVIVFKDERQAVSIEPGALMMPTSQSATRIP